MDQIKSEQKIRKMINVLFPNEKNNPKVDFFYDRINPDAGNGRSIWKIDIHVTRFVCSMTEYMLARVTVLLSEIRNIYNAKIIEVNFFKSCNLIISTFVTTDEDYISGWDSDRKVKS